METPPLHTNLNPPRAVVDAVARLVEPERRGAVLAGLSNYLQLTLAAGERMNLTGARDAGTFWTKHIEDSLLAAEAVAGLRPGVADGARILDVGSGAGLPGMVWALVWPGAQVALMEATGKKAVFLTETAAALGAGNVTVLNMRSEDAAHNNAHREKYDIVTARALAALNLLLELTLPFARVGGALAAVKGGDILDEWHKGRGAAAKLGGFAPVDPPGADYLRSDDCVCTLVWVEKKTLSPRQYPRPNGAAQRKPLR